MIGSLLRLRFKLVSSLNHFNIYSDSRSPYLTQKTKKIMSMQEIKGEDYSIQYDRASVTVSFIGELSLGGSVEYAPIVELLNEVANPEPPTITLNLKKLEFVNSSGISMLSKFVITVRKKKTIQLLVLGSNDVPWQQKSLKNLEKLLPTLKLELD